MVHVLPPTVEYLHLGMSKYNWDYTVSPSHRLRMFSAIERIQNLKKLHMHQWTAAVGCWIRDVDECTAPLLSLPDLKIVGPCSDRGAPEFPSILTFKVP